MSKKGKPKSVTRLAHKRVPGLDGTYAGTCIACLRPTDTALGFRGEPEWHAAGLSRLGLPMAEAVAMVETYGGEPGPDGRYDAVYRVCERCAARAGFPKPGLALPGEGVPSIGQPD